MPENQIIEATYGDIRLVPEVMDSPRSRSTPRLKWLSDVAASLWKFVTRGALILSVLAVLSVTISEFKQNSVVFEEIRLPEELVKMGLSGSVAAQRLWDSTQ